MQNNPLNSLSDYSRFTAELTNNSNIKRSTVSVWSDSPYTGILEGEIFFCKNVRLRLREELDFSNCLIASYGYEVYLKDKKIYWYDDFPHPNDPELSLTFPHHKNIHPNIKSNRICAPEISFENPNLPILIKEIEHILKSLS